MLNHSGLAWRTATLPPSYTLLIYSVWQIKSFLLHRLQSTACSTMSSSKGCRGMLSPSWRNFSCFAFDTFAHFISFSSSCVVFSLLSYMQVPRDAPNEADELCCSRGGSVAGVAGTDYLQLGAVPAIFPQRPALQAPVSKPYIPYQYTWQ